IPSPAAESHCDQHSCPTRRSSDLGGQPGRRPVVATDRPQGKRAMSMNSVTILSHLRALFDEDNAPSSLQLSAISKDTHMIFSERSEEHTSELQSRENLVCRLLLEK